MRDRLLAQLRVNPRLRVGLALIAGIVWLYLVLVMRDGYADKVGEYRNLASKVERLKAAQTETDWPNRLKSAKSLQADLEGGLWKNGTVGLARAAVQDWLNQRFIETGATHVMVNMAETKDGEEEGEHVPADLWKIKARIEFDFNQQTFNNLMVKLQNNKDRLVIESLHISKEPIPRVEAVLIAYCQKPRAAEQGG